MFNYGITFIVSHKVSFVLTQTQSNNQKCIAFNLSYKQALFFNKIMCGNLLLSKTSPLDHMQTMLKRPNISKNPNTACFQEEQESLWDPCSQMETATGEVCSPRFSQTHPILWNKSLLLNKSTKGERSLGPHGTTGMLRSCPLRDAHVPSLRQSKGCFLLLCQYFSQGTVTKPEKQLNTM